MIVKLHICSSAMLQTALVSITHLFLTKKMVTYYSKVMQHQFLFKIYQLMFQPPPKKKCSNLCTHEHSGRTKCWVYLLIYIRYVHRRLGTTGHRRFAECPPWANITENWWPNRKNWEPEPNRTETENFGSSSVPSSQESKNSVRPGLC